MNMRQCPVHDRNIPVVRYKRGFRDDQITHAASVQFLDSGIGRPVLYFCRLETIGHPAEPDYASRCKFAYGAGYLVSVRYGGGFRVSQIPETQQGFSIAV